MKLRIPFLIALAAITAIADVAEPSAKGRDWVREISRLSPGDVPLIKPCELSYTLSWNGLLNAGEAKVYLGLKDASLPEATIAEFSGRSTGGAKKLWYYKSKAKSVVHAKSLRPVSFESTEFDGKAKTVTEAKFDAEKVSSKETVEKRSGGEAKIREQTFPYGRVHDLMSTVLFLRSLPLKNGDEITMVIHPFKSAYLAKFKVLGREDFDSEIGKKSAIRLDIKLSKIGRDLELKAHDKFKKATIWVSDDEYRLPLEIRSELMLGSIRASLAKREFVKAAKN